MTKLTEYTVKPIGNQWAIVANGREIAKFDSNAKAWREADLLNGDCYNAKESRHDYAARQWS